MLFYLYSLIIWPYFCRTSGIALTLADLREKKKMWDSYSRNSLLQGSWIRMKYSKLIAAIIPILTLIGSSNSAHGYNDPKHCRGYNDCFGIGYDDGYLDAQKGLSPAFACVNHSQAWCAGYTDGYRPSNGGSNNSKFTYDSRRSTSGRFVFTLRNL